MKILFLPGMDGTGSLFNSLLGYLPNTFNVDVISLNDLQARTFDDQSVEIAEKIGSSPILLVAESYSGRIAYELCKSLGAQVQSGVFWGLLTLIESALPEVLFVSSKAEGVRCGCST